MIAATAKRRTLRKVTQLFKIIGTQEAKRIGIRFVRNREYCVCTFKFPEIFAIGTDVSMALAKVDLEINMQTQQVRVVAGKLPRASGTKRYLLVAVGLSDDQPVPELSWCSSDDLSSYRKACAGKPVAVVMIERASNKRMHVRSIVYMAKRQNYFLKGSTWC